MKTCAAFNWPITRIVPLSLIRTNRYSLIIVRNDSYPITFYVYAHEKKREEMEVNEKRNANKGRTPTATRSKTRRAIDICAQRDIRRSRTRLRKETRKRKETKLTPDYGRLSGPIRSRINVNSAVRSSSFSYYYCQWFRIRVEIMAQKITPARNWSEVKSSEDSMLLDIASRKPHIEKCIWYLVSLDHEWILRDIKDSEILKIEQYRSSIVPMVL